MDELSKFAAYACSLIPRNAAEEVFLLTRRIQFITNSHANDFLSEEEQELTRFNLKDVADRKDFLKQYNKIRKDGEVNAQ